MVQQSSCELEFSERLHIKKPSMFRGKSHGVSDEKRKILRRDELQPPGELHTNNEIGSRTNTILTS